MWSRKRLRNHAHVITDSLLWILELQNSLFKISKMGRKWIRMIKLPFCVDHIFDEVDQSDQINLNAGE